MQHVTCLNCGQVHADPGGPLGHYRCGRCGMVGQLVRVPPPPPPPEQSDPTPIVTGSLGALMGAALAGPVGVIVGGVLGWMLGNPARKA